MKAVVFGKLSRTFSVLTVERPELYTGHRVGSLRLMEELGTGIKDPCTTGII